MHITPKNIARTVLLLAPLALGGCLSFTSESHPAAPPQNTTVVVPPSGSTTTVVCPNGAPAPCN
jgi:hypothetical protein